MEEENWHAFDLDLQQDDVLSSEGHIYANYRGQLREVNLQYQRLLRLEWLLLGLPQMVSSDPYLWLRYMQNMSGKLHLFCKSSFERNTHVFTSCLMKQSRSNSSPSSSGKGVRRNALQWAIWEIEKKNTFDSRKTSQDCKHTNERPALTIFYR